MASIRTIKKRIRSVQNTSKITKAMEMVAASKMRKAQERALQARPYAEKLVEVMADLAAQPQGDQPLHPLLTRRPVSKIAILHMTSDKGLCGGMNANVNRQVGNFILGQGAEAVLITIGKKGSEFMNRSGRHLRAEFTGMSDRPVVEDTIPVARIVIDDYVAGLVDQVYISYSKFVSTAVQQPVVEELLPIEPADIPPGKNVDYIYEPNARDVLSDLLPRYVEMRIYQRLLENVASEQSARMVAMRNATDAANEMIEHLTLVYNKARQEQITTELLDIIAGAAAVKR